MSRFKKGLFYASFLVLCMVFTAYIYYDSIKKKIPDKLYIYTQDKAVFSMDIPVVGTVYDSSNNMCADILISAEMLLSSQDIQGSIM